MHLSRSYSDKVCVLLLNALHNYRPLADRASIMSGIWQMSETYDNLVVVVGGGGGGSMIWETIKNVQWFYVESQFPWCILFIAARLEKTTLWCYVWNGNICCIFCYTTTSRPTCTSNHQFDNSNDVDLSQGWGQLQTSITITIIITTSQK